MSEQRTDSEAPPSTGADSSREGGIAGAPSEPGAASAQGGEARRRARRTVRIPGDEVVRPTQQELAAPPASAPILGQRIISIGDPAAAAPPPRPPLPEPVQAARTVEVPALSMLEAVAMLEDSWTPYQPSVEALQLPRPAPAPSEGEPAWSEPASPVATIEAAGPAARAAEPPVELPAAVERGPSAAATDGPLPLWHGAGGLLGSPPPASELALPEVAPSAVELNVAEPSAAEPSGAAAEPSAPKSLFPQDAALPPEPLFPLEPLPLPSAPPPALEHAAPLAGLEEVGGAPSTEAEPELEEELMGELETGEFSAVPVRPSMPPPPPRRAALPAAPDTVPSAVASPSSPSPSWREAPVSVEASVSAEAIAATPIVGVPTASGAAAPASSLDDEAELEVELAADSGPAEPTEWMAPAAPEAAQEAEAERPPRPSVPPRPAPRQASVPPVAAVAAPVAAAIEADAEIDSEEVELAEVEAVVEVEAGEPAGTPAPPPIRRVADGPSPKEPALSLERGAPPPPKELTMTQPAAAGAEPSRKKAKVWWEELFNEDFQRAVRKHQGDDGLKADVDFIDESLAMEQGATILDLGCGTGRHAVELSKRGYRMVGLDLSLAMLARAAENAQAQEQRLNFVQADMREMQFEGAFDAVYCWDTTFGYFDEEKNAQVIGMIHRALRQGGRLLLDMINRDHIIFDSPNTAWFEGDGCVCLDEMHFDWITSRMRVKRTMMFDEGRNSETEYSIRLYSLHELGRLLHEQGFRVTEVSGMVSNPGVYFGCQSPRTIILAEKR